MSGTKAKLEALYARTGQRDDDIDNLIGHLIDNKRLQGAELQRWQEEQMQKKILELEQMLKQTDSKWGGIYQEMSDFAERIVRINLIVK